MTNDEDLRKLILKLVKEIKDVKKQNKKVMDNHVYIAENFHKILNANALLISKLSGMVKAVGDFTKQHTEGQKTIVEALEN